jgi:hypothetical protein
MSKYLPDHLWLFNTSNDPDVTPAFTAGFYIDIEHPYMDSSSFASTLFDDQRYDCSRIFGLSGWHALMPGHDGYSRADSQLLHRALSTRVFTGFAGAGMVLIAHMPVRIMTIIVRLAATLCLAKTSINLSLPWKRFS